MDNFIQEAMRTASPTRTDMPNMDLIHASLGMVTESAEFADVLKKYVYYGKELDKTNLKEELGDLLWYIALAMRELNTDFETEMDRVIRKLEVRYPDKFNKTRSLFRDSDKEREVLEQ